MEQTVRHCSTLTISGHCRGVEADMFGGSITTSTRRLFDFQNASTSVDSAFLGSGLPVISILEMAGIQHLNDVFENFINDIHPDWRIQLSDVTDFAYDMDVDDKILTLNSHGMNASNALQSNYFAPQIILALIEGLRMVRHVELLDGALEQYSPQMVIRIGRICMADCVTQTIKTAWDAKNDGYDASWKHLICGDYGQMAHKFASVMETFLLSNMDGDMAYNQSMAIMFNDWFALEDKIFQCDHESLNMIDDMIADDVQFGEKTLQSLTIACLTTTAGDTITYLQKPHVDDIADNPYYTSVQNPINRAHLSQLMNDMQSTLVDGVQFRDGALAARFMNQ